MMNKIHHDKNDVKSKAFRSSLIVAVAATATASSSSSPERRNPLVAFVSKVLQAIKCFFTSIFNLITGKTTMSTTSKKVSEFLNLYSIPTKLTQSGNIIGGKKYGEAKLKEIDEYMLKNKLRYSQRDPGRYPPILEPIKDDNKSSSSSSSSSSSTVVGLPSIKNVLDKVVPVGGVSSSSSSSSSSNTNFDIKASTAKTSNVGSVASLPIVDTPVVEKIVAKKKRSVLDLSADDLKGKRVLVRCDLNVPLKDSIITDDTRIRSSMPTIRYLVSNGAKVILSSHLGRPKGNGYEKKFSLEPIAERITELLGSTVPLVPDCIGLSVSAAVSTMKDGDVILLENVRFYAEEEKK